MYVLCGLYVCRLAPYVQAHILRVCLQIRLRRPPTHVWRPMIESWYAMQCLQPPKGANAHLGLRVQIKMGTHSDTIKPVMVLV